MVDGGGGGGTETNTPGTGGTSNMTGGYAINSAFVNGFGQPGGFGQHNAPGPNAFGGGGGGIGQMDSLVVRQ